MRDLTHLSVFRCVTSLCVLAMPKRFSFVKSTHKKLKGCNSNIKFHSSLLNDISDRSYLQLTSNWVQCNIKIHSSFLNDITDRTYLQLKSNWLQCNIKIHSSLLNDITDRTYLQPAAAPCVNLSKHDDAHLGKLFEQRPHAYLCTLRNIEGEAQYRLATAP